MWRPTVSLIVISLLVALAGAALTSEARAQVYPPPVGSLTLTSESTSAPTRASIGLTATLRDDQGNPIADQDVTFTIVSQPGDDASLGSLSHTVKSDQNGLAQVTLFTGSTLGQIVIDVVAGEKTSQITVQVLEEALPATGGPPPQDQDGEGFSVWLIAIIAGGALTMMGGLIILARHRA